VTEDATREELLRIAQALDLAGMMPSKSGNVSCRAGDGFLITPAGLPYAKTGPDDLVRTALDGRTTPDAKHRPSSEWQLHAAIYAARPEVGAVVHTHSPRATALSCARKGIPAFHYMVLLAGGPIACAEHATFGTGVHSPGGARYCLPIMAWWRWARRSPPRMRWLWRLKTSPANISIYWRRG